jgi:hypothetical protein
MSVGSIFPILSNLDTGKEKMVGRFASLGILGHQLVMYKQSIVKIHHWILGM